jgi:hypothetical protein
MALPAPGWVSIRAEAPVAPHPLPVRATYTYTDAWTDPQRRFRARTVDRVAGAASATAYVGAGDAGGALVELHVDDAYAVLLVDALLLQAPLEQGWAFVLDGHVFYVLNRVDDRSLVCDLTTGQWHVWLTAGEAAWNVHRGTTWRGRVLGADAFSPLVWEVDPESPLDGGVLPIERVVTGFLPVQGRGSVRQGSLRVTAGRDDEAPAGEIRMRFSDDGGATWSDTYEIPVGAGAGRRIEFRSLGRMHAPGRLWEFSDDGGLVRIDGVDTELDGGA